MIVRKIWLILANWIVSPYWFVIALILSGAVSGVQQGTLSSPNIFDIIITIILFIVFLPFILVSLLIHNTIAMVIYYAVSGGIICVAYYKYKAWRNKKLVKNITEAYKREG